MGLLKDVIMAKANIEHGTEVTWKSVYSDVYGGFAKPHTLRELSQLKTMRLFFTANDQDPVAVVRWLIQNWLATAMQIRSDEGLEFSPAAPVIGWAMKYMHRVLTLYRDRPQSKPYVECALVQSIAPVEPVAEPVHKATPESIAKFFESLK